jgi:hypothetical protein
MPGKGVDGDAGGDTRAAVNANYRAAGDAGGGVCDTGLKRYIFMVASPRWVKSLSELFMALMLFAKTRH